MSQSIQLESVESASVVGEPMHPDFVKIYRQFMKRYCGSPDKACKTGKSYYYGWLKKMGLDDTKPYGEQLAKLKAMLESFKWAKSQIQYWKSDERAKYYKVEACFPLSSMNNNIYTEDELKAATRTLIDKPVNLNHEGDPIEGVSIPDAEYEDGAAECVLRVTHQAGRLRGLNIQTMIDEEEIVHVSIEGWCKRGYDQTPKGWTCKGLVFAGLGLLTKDVLPGIPLTRIIPVESIVEYAHVKVTEEIKMKENKEITQKKSVDEPCDHEVTITTQANKIVQLEKKLQKETKAAAEQKLEVTELKRKTSDLRREIRTLNEKILSSESTAVAELNLKVSELKREQRDFKETIRTGETKLNAANEEVGVKEARIGELEHEIAEATKKINDSASRLSELRGLHNKLTGEHTDLVADHTKVKRTMEIQKESIESITRQMDEMQQRLDDCSEKRFKVSKDNIQLTQTLASRNDEILKLEQENEDLGDRLKKAKRVGRIFVKL